jgi:hypothetical protein
LEDEFATVATIHDVVDGAGLLNTHFSGHDEWQTALPAIVNTIIPGTDPFLNPDAKVTKNQPKIRMAITMR